MLECRPESNPPAVITWLRNGQSLSGTGNHYTVHNVQIADEGSYTCKARNNRGSTQGVVQMSIGSKFIVILRTHNVLQYHSEVPLVEIN